MKSLIKNLGPCVSVGNCGVTKCAMQLVTLSQWLWLFIIVNKANLMNNDF